MRRALVLVAAALALAGCPRAETVDCGDGRVCPAGTACVPDLPGCFPPAQAAVCEGLPDGRVCLWGGITGACQHGFCIAPACGNGLVEEGETCDDGDALSGDLCSSTCQLERCGNAVLDPGEDCDCGDDTVPAGAAPALCNDLPNDDEVGVCDSRCDLLCGDGSIQPPEQCDGEPPVGLDCADVGFDAGSLGCSSYCTLDTAACEVIGLRPVPTDTVHDIVSIWGSGDRVIAIDAIGATIERVAGQWGLGGGGGSAADVHGVGPDDVIIVGDGLAWHWEGDDWTISDPQTTAALRAVWMPRAGEAWAVGDAGTVRRWREGAGWAPVALPVSDVLTDVYAVDDHVFVSSMAGDVWHKVGAAPFVRTAFGPALLAIAGAAADDVTVVGSDGLVARWDGASWSVEPAPTAATLFDVWTDADEAFAVGSDGVIVHRDEHGWKRLRRSTTTTFGAIGGPRADDLVVGGANGALYAYAGQGWADTDLAATADLHGLWYTPGTGAVIGGDDGLVIQEDRGVFTALPPAQVQTGPFLRTIHARAIYAPAPDRVFATGGETSPVGVWDGASWTSIDHGLEPRHGLWGDGGEAFWSVGVGIRRWDGEEWLAVDRVFGAEYRAIWGSATGTILAVGDQQSAHFWPSSGWQQSETQYPAAGVWIDEEGREWTVGVNALIVSVDDLEGPVEHLPFVPADFAAIHGAAADDVWVVGTGGTLARFDGARWYQVRTPTFVDLTDVWVTPTMVYATGAEGTLLRLVRSTP